MQLDVAAKLETLFLCRALWRGILLLESSRLQLGQEGQSEEFSVPVFGRRVDVIVVSRS
jgi:hypothetical protein